MAPSPVAMMISGVATRTVARTPANRSITGLRRTAMAAAVPMIVASSEAHNARRTLTPTASRSDRSSSAARYQSVVKPHQPVDAGFSLTLATTRNTSGP